MAMNRPPFEIRRLLMSCARSSHGIPSFSRSAWRGLVIAALAGGILLPATAWAQTKKKAANDEKKSGKIAAVEKKGKAANVTVEEADGEKFDVLVSGKMKFVVNGTGDV